MNPFNRLLWLLGAIVCVAVLAAACSGPPPSATEELLLPTNERTPSPDQPSTTPAEATQPLPVATSALPAPSPTRAEPSGTGGREIRLTPTKQLLLEPVPTVAEEAVTGEVPEDLLNAILADAADRSGLPVEAFTVLRDEAVTWSDGSLGCPQPDVIYTQALVPGYRVVVAVGDQTFDYRAAQSGFFTLCERDLPVPITAPGGVAPTPEQ